MVDTSKDLTNEIKVFDPIEIRVIDQEKFYVQAD